MNFNFTIEGLDKIENATREIQAGVVAEVNKALYASALKVEKAAKQSILSGGKSGRIYKRRTVTHQASAPGESPATDTGRLVNSISSYLDSTSLTSFVLARAKYAAYLEFGTHKIAPRPFMFPALEQNRAWIQERLNQAVRTAAMKSIR